MLAGRLQGQGYEYGDFPAHSSLWDLWEMAAKMWHGILARIALAPRTMEARGLEAAPASTNSRCSKSEMELLALVALHRPAG